MKNNIRHYFDTLKEPDNELSTFVNFSKIIKNISEVQIHLNALNYLICNSKQEFTNRLSNLFSINKDCFSVLPILIAVRQDFKSLLPKKDFIVTTFDVNDINLFFNKTKLIDLILDGKIKNFIDYVYGIEVGLDTNARKNRNGKFIEDYLKNYLIKYFDNMQEIEIHEQKQLSDIVGKLKIDAIDIDVVKKFDFIIVNKIKNKILLLESSFYNAGGSKISETSRSYYDIFKKIKNYETNIRFIWIADGIGMKTIKNDLEKKYHHEYITNINLLANKLNWIII